MIKPNPFKPTAGKRPPILIGRDDVLDEFEESLVDGAGAPARLMRISGARGVGKTVMLNELARLAEDAGWTVVDEIAREGFTRRILARLSSKTKVSALKLQPTVLGMGLGTVEIERSELDLYDAMEKASKPHGLIVTLDEVQDAPIEEMRVLTQTVHRMIQKDLDIAFVFAGLSSAIDTITQAKSLTFIRRAMPVELGLVPIKEATRAYEQAVQEAGVIISHEGARIMAEASAGYPFMVQLVGYHAWQAAARREGAITSIEQCDIERGIDRARERFGKTVIEVALKELAPSELRYLYSMTEDGGRPSATGEIARRLGKPITSLSPLRSRLIAAGIIESPRRGEVQFALPYLYEYLIERMDETL